MINYSDKIVFGKILSPLMLIINSTSDRLGDDDKKYKLLYRRYSQKDGRMQLRQKRCRTVLVANGKVYDDLVPTQERGNEGRGNN